MDTAEAIQFVAVMLAPTVLVGTGLLLPRTVRAVGRWRKRHRVDDTMQPRHAPIEELAADLRRLLQRHDALKRANDVAMRARHLKALEAAIGDCAIEAALALDLPCPERDDRRALSVPELRTLLRALADAGLMLVPATGLFAAEGHS